MSSSRSDGVATALQPLLHVDVAGRAGADAATGGADLGARLLRRLEDGWSPPAPRSRSPPVRISPWASARLVRMPRLARGAGGDARPCGRRPSDLGLNGRDDFPRRASNAAVHAPLRERPSTRDRAPRSPSRIAWWSVPARAASSAAIAASMAARSPLGQQLGRGRAWPRAPPPRCGPPRRAARRAAAPARPPRRARTNRAASARPRSSVRP